MSSKAVRSALRSQEAIFGDDMQQIPKAVRALEALLNDPSFKRLDTHAQMDIILLLSKGYARLAMTKEQEQLLLKYAKQKEFYRHYIPLMAELSYAYAAQERFEDEEKILAKLAQPSACHLSLEEKRTIGNAINVHDNSLSCLLQTAYALAQSGKLQESFAIYQKVFPSIKKHKYPYQGSSLERKKLYCKIALNMAEIKFCIGDFQKAIDILSDDQGFTSIIDEKIAARRCFILASSYSHTHDIEAAKNYWNMYSKLHLNPNITDEIATKIVQDENNQLAIHLWAISHALANNDSNTLLRHADLVHDMATTVQHSQTNTELSAATHIAQGMQQAIRLNIADASFSLQKGIEALKNQESPWKEAAMALLAELNWQRLVLFLESHQEERAHSLAANTIRLLEESSTPSTLSRKQCFQAFLANSIDGISIDESCNGSASTLLQALQSNHPLTDCLVADHLFFLWYTQKNFPNTKSDWAPEHIDQHAAISAPLIHYLKMIATFRSALLDETDASEAVSILTNSLNHPEHIDVRPQILHCLIELSLHTSNFSQANTYLKELIHASPEYPRLSEIAFFSAHSFESVPECQSAYADVCSFFWKSPPNIFTFLLATHLFETQHQLITDHHPAVKALGLSLLARAEGKSSFLEAEKSKEPAIVKERIDIAKKKYEISHMYAKEALVQIQNPEARAFFYGLILTMQREFVEHFLTHIVTSSAFNELPRYLEEAKHTLETDISELTQDISSSEKHIQNDFVFSCSLVAQASEMYLHAFRNAPINALPIAEALVQKAPNSHTVLKAILCLSKKLRETLLFQQAYDLLQTCDETSFIEPHYELALEFAMEKSLCLKSLGEIKKAMARLAWIINRPYPSSLRIKAMILRADIYREQHRIDLAIRQLESVATKGGEWKAVAERKLQELYGTI